MKIYFYSAGCNCFYPGELRDDYAMAGTWPDDAKMITNEVYQEFAIFPAPDGMVMIAGSNGMPEWGKIPPPSHEELIASAEREKSRLMSDAEAAIAPLKRAVKYNMATDAEKASLEQWEVYSVLLSRVDTSLAPDIEWPPVPA